MRIARRLRDHLRSSTLECLTLAPETLDTARSLRRGAASRPAGRELMPHQEDRIAHRKANANAAIVLGGTVRRPSGHTPPLVALLGERPSRVVLCPAAQP